MEKKMKLVLWDRRTRRTRGLHSYHELALLYLYMLYTVAGLQKKQDETHIHLGVFLEGSVDDRLLLRMGDYVNSSHTTVFFDIVRNRNGSTLDSLYQFTKQISSNNNTTKIFITHVSCDTDLLFSSLNIQDGRVRLVLTSGDCAVSDIHQEHPVFHLSPPSSLLFSAIESILQHQQLHFAHVFILYDDHSTKMEISKLVVWLTSNGALSCSALFLSQSQSQGQSEGQKVKQMKHILAHITNTKLIHDRSVFTYIVLLYTQNNAWLFLNQAADDNLHTNLRLSWLVAGRDIIPEVMKLSRWRKRNLVFLTSDLWRVLKENQCPFVSQLITSRTMHNHTNAAIYLADAVLIAVRAVVSPGVNNTNCPPRDTEGLGQVFQAMSFNGLSKDIKFDNLGYNNQATYDVIRAEVDKLVHVGIWKETEGLQVASGAIFRNHFTHFEGETLNIAMIPVAPFVMKTVNFTAENHVSYTGFCVDIVEELRSRLNFSYRVVSPTPPMIGQELPDGNWSGEIGMVLRGEASMIAGPVTITMERTKVIDFTSIYMEDDSSIIMKTPKAPHSPLSKIFEPFHPLVWVSTGLAGLVFSIFLAVANHVNPSEGPEEHDDGGDKDQENEMEIEGCLVEGSTSRRNIVESAWSILAHVHGQSAVFYPTTVSGRTLIIFWWLFTILISAYYTANLAAKLTAPMSIAHIETINELAAQTAIRPLIKNSTSLEALFKDINSDILSGFKGARHPSAYATVAQLLKKSEPFPVDNDEAFGMVRQGGIAGAPYYAFMGDSSQLKYELAQNCDQYVLGREGFYTGGFGFVIPKDAIYRDAVSNTLSKMREAGLIDHLSRKYWPENMCAAATPTSKAILSFPAVSGAFTVCGIFSALALLIFIIELKCRYLVSKTRNISGRKSSSDRAAAADTTVSRGTGNYCHHGMFRDLPQAGNEHGLTISRL